MARILGIDIDHSAVRAAVVRTTFRHTEVERYLQIPLTEPPGGPGRLPELHDALGNLLRALGKPPDSCITSLDGTHASLRNVELPVAAAKRVAEVLPFELESMLPFEISDAVTDYQPSATKGAQVVLLAAAALKDRVRAHLGQFQGTAIDPREIAVGAAALDGLRLLCPALTQAPVALLELCDRETNVCVLERGHCTFARTISVGWDGDPKHEAELWQGVHRTLAAYRAGGGAVLESLQLCGMGPLHELAPWLARELSLSVSVLELPAPVGDVAGAPVDLPAFARAAALAVRATTSGKRINLRSGEFASNRSQTELASHLNLLAVGVVAVLLTVMFSLKAQQSVLEEEQAALRKKLESATGEIFGKPMSDPAKVEAMLSGPQSDSPLPRFDAYDALAAISDAVPPEITHEMQHLRIDLAEEKKEGQLEMRGILASIDQRDQIVTKLEAHGCFQDIERGRTAPGRTAEQITYQLEAKVQCPGEAVKKKTSTTRSEEDE